MKNLRKIVESMVEEFIEKNPPTPDVGFTAAEALVAAGELVDTFEAVASVAWSLERIADILERRRIAATAL